MDAMIKNYLSNLSLRNFLFGLLLLSSLFPWSPPIFQFTDLQPTTFIFSLLYVLFFVRKIAFVCIFPLTALVFSFLIMFIYGVNLNSVRGVYPYFSFTLILLATLEHLRYKIHLNLIIFYISIFIWLFVSLVQYQYPEIVLSLISREYSTAFSQERGASSFAPEPTFYAIQMLFISIAFFLLYLYKSIQTREFYIIQFILIVQILILSKSALVIILLAIFITLYCFLFKFKYFLLAPSIVVLIWYLDIGRLGAFLNRKDRFIGDASFSDRISQIFYSHYYAIIDFLTPHGYNSWQYVNASIFENVLGFNSINTNPRILSLSGTIIFELGIFGAPFLLFLFIFPFISLKNFSFRCRFGITTLISLLFVNAIPLALPIIAVIYALLINIYQQNKFNSNE